MTAKLGRFVARYKWSKGPVYYDGYFADSVPYAEDLQEFGNRLISRLKLMRAAGVHDEVHEVRIYTSDNDCVEGDTMSEHIFWLKSPDAPPLYEVLRTLYSAPV